MYYHRFWTCRRPGKRKTMFFHRFWACRRFPGKRNPVISIGCWPFGDLGGNENPSIFIGFWVSRRSPGEQNPCVFIGVGPPGGFRGSENLVFSQVLEFPAASGAAKSLCSQVWAPRRSPRERIPCIFIGFGPSGGLRGSENLVFSKLLSLPAVSVEPKTLRFHSF